MVSDFYKFLAANHIENRVMSIINVYIVPMLLLPILNGHALDTCKMMTVVQLLNVFFHHSG